MGTELVRRATHSDVDAVSRLVAEAFQHLRVCEWLVTDPASRLDVLAANFAIYVEHALTYGVVDCTDDGTAAAVWLDQTRDVPPPPEYAARLAAACGPWTDRFELLDELFEAHHPHRAHHHLALLAVAPERQRQGIGTSLLLHHHAELDRQGIGAYLEASSTGSRDLYARHGYQPHGEPFAMPNGALFWPMWRHAAPR